MYYINKIPLYSTWKHVRVSLAMFVLYCVLGHLVIGTFLYQEICSAVINQLITCYKRLLVISYLPESFVTGTSLLPLCCCNNTVVGEKWSCVLLFKMFCSFRFVFDFPHRIHMLSLINYKTPSMHLLHTHILNICAISLKI